MLTYFQVKITHLLNHMIKLLLYLFGYNQAVVKLLTRIPSGWGALRLVQI